MNKKMLIGASALVTLSGVAVIGSIFGGVALANNRREKLFELEEKKKSKTLNEITESSTNLIGINSDFSIVSTKTAKLVFEIPSKFVDQNITLKFTRQAKKNEQGPAPSAVSVLQYVSKKEPRAIFVLENLLSNYVYNYEIIVSGATRSTGSFLTKFTPTATAVSGYKSADLTISGLGSFTGQTLMVKAVPAATFVGLRAEEQFRNTVFSQLFNVPYTEKPDASLSTKITFRPVGLDNASEYRFVVFDNEGLVPLMDLANPPMFSTLEGKLTLSNFWGYNTSASVQLNNVTDFAGSKLKLAYHEVKTDTGLFLARNAKVLEVEIPENIQTYVANIPDLKPNTKYKMNVYPALDKDLKDPFFVTGSGIASSDFKFETNEKPTIFAEEALDNQTYPYLEARAAKLAFKDLKGYFWNTLKVKITQKPTSGNPDWNSAVLGGELSEIITTGGTSTEVDATKPVSNNTTQFSSTVIGLEAGTEYVYQLFGGDDRTPLLNANGSFTTMKGFDSVGVTVTTPLSVLGQTESTLKFATDQLLQFYKEPVTPPTSSSDTSASATVATPPTNQLEIRYAKVKLANEIVDWSSSTDILKANLTISKETDGTLKIADHKLSSLTKGSLYKAAIFLAPNKLARVSDVVTFETNTAITGTVLKLDSKVLLSLENLKTYKDKELSVALYKKGTTPTTEDTKKFKVNEQFVESLEFSDLESSTEYEYKVSVMEEETSHELLKESVSTISSEITARIPADTINPTSVILRLEHLVGLKNQNVSIIYRKKVETNDAEWKVFDLGEITHGILDKTIIGLEADTDYEFNIVWDKANSFPILKQHVVAKTKTFVNIQTSNIKQTSVKFNYSNYALYPNQSLVLKYWQTAETELTQEVKEVIALSTATGASMVSVPLKITDSTTLFSVATNLSPNTGYAYQLFNGSVPVSDMELFKTEKQLVVLETEAFVSGFRVNLSDLNTITGDDANKLILQVIEKSSSSSSSTPTTKNFKFTRNSDSQEVLAYGLDKEKTYVFQVYKESDVEFKNPIITTNSVSDKREIALLIGDSVPTLKVEQFAAKSALLQFDKLSKFVGKTLVIKYKPTYWEDTSKENIAVESSIKTVVEQNKLDYQLLNLVEGTEYNYEVYVEVAGTTDKITLLEQKTSASSREKFKTGSTKITPKSGVNFVLPTIARLNIVNASTYKKVQLILKALPKEGTSDWDSNEVIKSSLNKIGYNDSTTEITDFSDSSEVIFNLSGLKNKTEYKYQVFAEGLSEPLLKEDGIFATKGLIKIQASEIHAEKMRLLLSNLDTYVGQKLKVQYREKTDTTGAGAGSAETSWNSFETVVSNSGSAFTSETVVPIPIYNLKPKKDYEFKVTVMDNTTESANLLESGDYVVTTLSKEVEASAIIASQPKTARILLEKIGNLKDIPLKLSWKLSTETNWLETQKIKFVIPASTTTDYYILSNDSALSGLADSGTYDLKLEPDYEKNSYNDKMSVDLLATSKKTFDVAKLVPTFTPKSSFTKEEKNKIKASSLLTKAKILEKFDAPTLEGWTLELKDNTTDDVTYISANDFEGKLIVKVVFGTTTSTNVDTYTFEIDGFQKVSASDSSAEAKPVE